MLHKNNKSESVTDHSSFQLNLSQTNPLEFSNDLFGEIIQYLNFNDLVNLAKVSKKLKELIEGMTFKDLITGTQGTYAELHQIFMMNVARRSIVNFEHHLGRHKKPHTKIPLWPAVLILGLAAYVALESYFIFRIYHDDEYHVERNVTRCIEVKNDHSEEGLEYFKKHGCHDNGQGFVVGSAIFGVLMPLMVALFTVLASGSKLKLILETRIDQHEWKPLLSKINKVLAGLEKLMPNNMPINSIEEQEEELDSTEKFKIALADLNKRTLTFSQLKKSLKRASDFINYKKELFNRSLLFKHQPKKLEPKGEVRIDVNPAI